LVAHELRIAPNFEKSKPILVAEKQACFLQLFSDHVAMPGQDARVVDWVKDPNKSQAAWGHT
jgi:hypothetical protein